MGQDAFTHTLLFLWILRLKKYFYFYVRFEFYNHSVSDGLPSFTQTLTALRCASFHDLLYTEQVRRSVAAARQCSSSMSCLPSVQQRAQLVPQWLLKTNINKSPEVLQDIFLSNTEVVLIVFVVVSK